MDADKLNMAKKLRTLSTTERFFIEWQIEDLRNEETRMRNKRQMFEEMLRHDNHIKMLNSSDTSITEDK